MSNDRTAGTIGLVTAGRSHTQAVHEAARIVMKDHSPTDFPVIEVIHENPTMLNKILDALEENGIMTRPPPPIRRKKKRPPSELQERTLRDAKEKRERRRQKRLKNGFHTDT